MALNMVRAVRQEPKRVFPCVLCDPPPSKRRIQRRYLFVLSDQGGAGGDYCLPCASKLLDKSQGSLRRQADSSEGVASQAT